MMETERESDIRRILVALDASPHSLAALDAAAELAARLQAELMGLFVEDINLLRLAGLPFAREIHAFSGRPRDLDSQYMERELRAQAERARRALARAAEQAQVRWSFRVARGAVLSEVLQASAEADLISLGKLGWSASTRRELGSTARGVLSQARCHALLIQHEVPHDAPVLVLYDGSAGAAKALSTAARLAQGRDGRLTVLIVARTPAVAQRLQTQVAERLREWDVQAHYRQLIGADASWLAQVVRAEGNSLVVLPDESPLLQGEARQELLNELECVLLVR